MSKWGPTLNDKFGDSRWTLYAKGRIRLALGLKTRVVFNVHHQVSLIEVDE